MSPTVRNRTTGTITEAEDRRDIPGSTAWPYKSETEPLYVGADVPDMITCQPLCEDCPGMSLSIAEILDLFEQLDDRRQQELLDYAMQMLEEQRAAKV